MKGIDISHYQNEKGKIDWTKVKQAGFEFVIIKATEASSYLDPYLKINQADIRNAGLALGYYHFARLGDYKKEADWFLKNIGEIRQGEFLALDFELRTHPNPAEWCRNWLDYVESKVGFKPLLYTYHDILLKYDWKRVSEGNFGLWAARYGLQEQEPNEKYAPTLGPWPFIAIWQHSSRGIVPGIVGNVDLNYAPMKLETLLKYGKPENENPIPLPSPTPSTKGKVISRKQGDPRWGAVKIGQSNRTLASDGCLINIISDALHWMGIDLLPDYLAKNLRFTYNVPGLADGLFYWNSLDEKTLAKFVTRQRQFYKVAVDTALKHPTQCVFLEFNFAGARHWVWALGRDWAGRYRIADPLRGDFATHTRYGKIIGYAIIDLK